MDRHPCAMSVAGQLRHARIAFREGLSFASGSLLCGTLGRVLHEGTRNKNGLSNHSKPQAGRKIFVDADFFPFVLFPRSCTEDWVEVYLGFK